MTKVRDVLFELESRWVWMALAMQGGMINVFGFLSTGHFVSHVTGTAGGFAFFIEALNFYEAFIFLLLPISFFIGAFIAAYFTEVRRVRNRHPIYFVPLSFMALLYMTLALGGVLGIWGGFYTAGPTQKVDIVLMGLLGLVMGLQNGLFTAASKGTMRTTHITGLVTDLGIGLALSSFKHIKFFHRQNVDRLCLIGAFFVGSFIGAFYFKYCGTAGLVFNAGLSFFIGRYLYRRKVESYLV